METEQRPTTGDNEGAIIGTQLRLAASMKGAAAGRAVAAPEVANQQRADLFRVISKYFSKRGGAIHLALTRAGGRRPPLVSMKLMMRSSPSLFFKLVMTNSRSPRILRASVSIFSSDAPTYGARSILLITSRSERVMPGPPLEGILSPAATSIT